MTKPPTSKTTDLLPNQFRISPFRVEAPCPRESQSGLERLIAADDLTVVFQPIVTVGTHEVFAYEALVRCRLPQYKSPPDLFRRAVEENCTGRLGRMIRELALGLVPDAPLFINVHPVELQESWLVRPDDPLYLHAHPIYLEVTEAVPLRHFPLCRDVLSEVRSRGDVKIVVDDLGAGYSNLKHIVDLAPSIVKLDRQLIVGIEHSSRQRQLVKSLVRLCDDMGAQVVAEGVETVDEYSAIKDTGAQLLQGYLFARPAFPLPPINVIE